MEKGDIVCYKGDRSALGTVSVITVSALRSTPLVKKAGVIWLTGPKIGTKQTFDTRDLVIVNNEI
jgi:hypothetical protein